MVNVHWVVFDDRGASCGHGRTEVEAGGKVELCVPSRADDFSLICDSADVMLRGRLSHGRLEIVAETVVVYPTGKPGEFVAAPIADGNYSVSIGGATCRSGLLARQ